MATQAKDSAHNSDPVPTPDELLDRARDRRPRVRVQNATPESRQRTEPDRQLAAPKVVRLHVMEAGQLDEEVERIAVQLNRRSACAGLVRSVLLHVPIIGHAHACSDERRLVEPGQDDQGEGPLRVDPLGRPGRS